MKTNNGPSDPLSITQSELVFPGRPNGPSDPLSITQSELVFPGRPNGPSDPLSITQSELVFPGRPVVQVSCVARFRVWESRCGRYRVVHAHVTLGEDLPRGRRWPDRYTAQQRDEAGWRVLSRHRKRTRALAACRRHAGRKRGPA